MIHHSDIPREGRVESKPVFWDTTWARVETHYRSSRYSGVVVVRFVQIGWVYGRAPLGVFVQWTPKVVMGVDHNRAGGVGENVYHRRSRDAAEPPKA